MGFFGLTFMDRNKQKSSIRLRIGPVTAGTLAGYLTTTGTLRSAIEALTLTTVQKTQLLVFDNLLSNVVPTSGFAKRELKLLVKYRDVEEFFDAPTNSIYNENFGQSQTAEIPGPNLALPDIYLGDTEYLDLTQTQVAAFKTAFEAVVLSDGGGDVQIESIKVVGRNL